MRKNQKGFTLVELLVVIAILAILATVAVVGYTSFIESANESNDKTVVSQINKVLDGTEVLEGEMDLGSAIDALLANGVDFKDLKLRASGHTLKWDSNSKRFVIVDGDKIVYAPSGVDTNNVNLSNVFTELESEYDETLTINEDTIIDLGGKTVTFKNPSTLTITNKATVVIMDSTGNGKITADKFKGWLVLVKGESNLILESGEICGNLESSHNNALVNVYGGSTLTINGGKISVYASEPSLESVAVCVFNNNSKIYMNGGTIECQANTTAISGIGNSEDAGTYIEINDGTIRSDAIAIYHPQDGKLVINGGNITGYTCLWMKAGKLTVNGGNLKATGKHKSVSYNGNGAYATGDAIVIDSAGYPGGVPGAYVINANINVTDEDNKEIVVYVLDGNDNPKVTYNGSEFTDFTKYTK